MVNRRSTPRAAPSAAVLAAGGGAEPSSAAGDTSAATKSSPPTPIVAGARGDSPREVDPSLKVDYECDSDERAESLGLVKLPECRATDYEPSKPKVRKTLN